MHARRVGRRRGAPLAIEADADAAARSVFDCLLGLITDAVVLDTASEGGYGERVGVSTGVDRKVWDSVRAPGSLLERLQRRVSLQALRESGSSFGTEFVPVKTASTQKTKTGD